MPQSKTSVEEALATLGISDAELREFVQKKQASRPTLTVQENEGDERKFGEVSLIKVHNNGYRKPFGLSGDQIDAAIEGLTAYRAKNPR